MLGSEEAETRFGTTRLTIGGVSAGTPVFRSDDSDTTYAFVRYLWLPDIQVHLRDRAPERSAVAV
jgi:hypothetical protein